MFYGKYLQISPFGVSSSVIKLFEHDCYEQELKTKRFSRRKSNSIYENKDGNPRSPRSASGLSNLKTGENAAGSSSLEESGGASSQRKQNKGFSKQQSFHKQRFFSSNLKNHGTSHNSIAIISESPPSNSVGYFFGSTPPDSHGLVLSDHLFILNILTN